MRNGWLCLILFWALTAGFPALAYFQKGVIYEPTPALPSAHASTIVELPDRDLLCVWYSGKAEGARDVAEWASRFERKTGQWSKPCLLVDTPGKPEGNPVLFVAPDKKVYLFYATMEGLGWSSCSLKFVVSEDGGRTFGPPQIFRRQWGWLPRNHLLTLSSGEIVFPLYNESPSRSEFMLSADGCRTWVKAGQIKTRPGNLQPAVVELEDHSLLSMMRMSGKGQIWQSQSQDKGMSWSPAVRTALPNPDAGIDLVRLKSGELVLAFNNSGTRRSPLSLALSKDNGRTWPVIKDVETDDAEFSYPSLTTDSEGRLWLTYTWKRKTIGYAVFDLDWLKQ